ncbi:MAG: hypothetical protein ABI416_18715 [Ginsengibacter sp.]
MNFRNLTQPFFCAPVLTQGLFNSGVCAVKTPSGHDGFLSIVDLNSRQEKTFLQVRSKNVLLASLQ